MLRAFFVLKTLIFSSLILVSAKHPPVIPPPVWPACQPGLATAQKHRCKSSFTANYWYWSCPEWHQALLPMILKHSQAAIIRPGDPGLNVARPT